MRKLVLSGLVLSCLILSFLIMLLCCVWSWSWSWAFTLLRIFSWACNFFKSAANCEKDVGGWGLLSRANGHESVDRVEGRDKTTEREQEDETTARQRPNNYQTGLDNNKTMARQRCDKDKAMARKDNTCLTSFSGNGLKEEDTDLSTMAKRGRMLFTVSTMRFTCSPPIGGLIRVRVRLGLELVLGLDWWWRMLITRGNTRQWQWEGKKRHLSMYQVPLWRSFSVKVLLSTGWRRDLRKGLFDYRIRCAGSAGIIIVLIVEFCVFVSHFRKGKNPELFLRRCFFEFVKHLPCTWSKHAKFNNAHPLLPLRFFFPSLHNRCRYFKNKSDMMMNRKAQRSYKNGNISSVYNVRANP